VLLPVKDYSLHFCELIDSRPGSGKSTAAYPLTDRLNELLGRPTHASHVDARGDIASPAEEAGTEGEIAICVGLDGWHYSRRELDGFDDPVEAHWRRVRPHFPPPVRYQN
jgi:hypothetical protein